MENTEKQITTEQVQQPAASATTTEINKEELFKTLNEVLDKRTDGLLKSILKTNGVEDDGELKSLIAEYKNHKATKTKVAEDELATLKRTNAELNQRIKTGERNTAIAKVAAQLGISDGHLKYVTKLADLTNIEKDGQFDEELIKAALQTVIDEIPAFKTETKTETENGFVKIGSKKTEETKDDLEANRIRKLMGLPELKK
jgi:hypothetical protein